MNDDTHSKGNTVHEQTNTSPGPIIVGVDQTSTARAAVRQAATVAAQSGRALHLVHAVGKRAVIEVGGVGAERFTVDLQRAAENMLASLRGELRCSSPVTTAAVVGRPAAVLCAEARQVGASLIVLGNRGVQRRFRSTRSIAGAVARHAPCDVEVVHTHHGATPLVVQFA